jgi:hypothetical protein
MGAIVKLLDGFRSDPSPLLFLAAYPARPI